MFVKAYRIRGLEVGNVSYPHWKYYVWLLEFCDASFLGMKLSNSVISVKQRKKRYYS